VTRRDEPGPRKARPRSPGGRDALVVGWTPDVPGLTWLRPRAFWALDALRGRRVRTHLQDIEQILGSSAAETEAHRQQRLAALLAHATRTVPLYQRHGGFSSLADFPVVDKNVLRDAKDSALSRAYAGRRLYVSTTSGSTGTPFSARHDANKRARHMADLVYFGRAAGYEIGSRLYELKVFNRTNLKSFVERLSQNVVALEISDLSDRTMAGILDTWRRDRAPKSVYSYCSTLEVLAAHLAALPPGPLDLRVRTIMAGGESLSEPAKAILKDRLACAVVVRYSNLENGFLGQQCLEENREYHINWASYHIELLAMDSDEAARPGEIGRIVVTDLFNHAMPMIRYDTGDTGVFGERGACGWPFPVLRTVEGRRMDLLTDARGNLVSPGSLTNGMWKYTEVRQFQFIQTGATDYLMKLNCQDDVFDRQAELIADVQRYLGEDASIRVEYVDGIPLLASGKRKEVMNTYRLAAGAASPLGVAASTADDPAIE
jgi:phenylacetate-CoA ligase